MDMDPPPSTMDIFKTSETPASILSPRPPTPSALAASITNHTDWCNSMGAFHGTIAELEGSARLRVKKDKADMEKFPSWLASDVGALHIALVIITTDATPGDMAPLLTETFWRGPIDRLLHVAFMQYGVQRDDGPPIHHLMEYPFRVPKTKPTFSMGDTAKADAAYVSMVAMPRLPDAPATVGISALETPRVAILLFFGEYKTPNKDPTAQMVYGIVAAQVQRWKMGKSDTVVYGFAANDAKVDVYASAFCQGNRICYTLVKTFLLTDPLDVDKFYLFVRTVLKAAPAFVESVQGLSAGDLRVFSPPDDGQEGAASRNYLIQENVAALPGVEDFNVGKWVEGLIPDDALPAPRL
ncbi:hypothetical protein FRB99_002881 [Tulasnella sp. 403]|nr:hypothetical protein FRB99_002881 [Tulasnella sp. 403]